MDSEIKLSVLITFCNQKEFIKDALDSVINQKTDFEYEVLIGLDGEDAESEKIIKSYMSIYDNLKLFKCNNSTLNTINIEKASNNRVNLIKNAIGEYFCILDGDDFYTDKNRFQKLVDILDSNQEIIGCAHSLSLYNNKTKEFTEHKLLKTEYTLDANKYINKRLHLSSNVFIFRNIFYGRLPDDFPSNFFNDSTLTYYMLKYGKIHYIPHSMLAYRTNIKSIYNSESKLHKKIIELIAAEINHKILSSYEELLCKKNSVLLLKCLKFINKQHSNDCNLISDFAKKNNCYFSYNILNFNNLNIKEKVNFFKNIFNYVLKKQYICKFKNADLLYFNDISNFGDCLNLYIIQRLLNRNVKKAHKSKANLSAIGSILESFLLKKIHLILMPSPKPVNIWGSGFIEAPNLRHHPSQKFFRHLNILALRGELTKQRCERILQKSLDDIALGDPGLLANKLIDTTNIKKKHKVGIILHYADSNIQNINNIDIEDYKIIDITQNPLKILREIAKCEVIFSSAMHGLIAADALGIPNQWIQLSNNVYGKNYKFFDYYSVYDINNPQPIDLRISKINNNTVEALLRNYHEKISPKKTEAIQKNLLESFKNYKES